MGYLIMTSNGVPKYAKLLNTIIANINTFKIFGRFDRNLFVSTSLSRPLDWVIATHSPFENREFQALGLAHGPVTV